MTMLPKLDYQSFDDLVLARLIAARCSAAVRLVTTRNNQRLFRDEVRPGAQKRAGR